MADRGNYGSVSAKFVGMDKSMDEYDGRDKSFESISAKDKEAAGAWKGTHIDEGDLKISPFLVRKISILYSMYSV